MRAVQDLSLFKKLIIFVSEASTKIGLGGRELQLVNKTFVQVRSREENHALGMRAPTFQENEFSMFRKCQKKRASANPCVPGENCDLYETKCF